MATQAGLDRFRDYTVVTLSTKEDLPNVSGESLLAARDGSIWVGTTDGLARWSKGVVRRFSGSGLTARSSLFQDHGGRIWVGGHDRVGYFENDRFIPVDRVPSGWVYALAEEPVGTLWIANLDRGLLELRNNRLEQLIPWTKFGNHGFALTMASDRWRSGLWLGFSEGGLAYFRDGQVRAFYGAAQGLGKGAVNALQFDDEGTLWAATASGLSRLKNGRVTTLSSKNGLPCDAVNWVIEDDDRSLWLYMPCGLVRIRNSELEGWASNPGRTVQATVLDSSYGVRTRGSFENIGPNVAKSPDGKIWFTTFDGLSVIDPRHLLSNKLPPPVYIEQLTVDQRTYSNPTNGMRLSAGVQNLTFDFVALSLVAPERNRYRYKLEGWDRGWREAVNEFRIEYSNLPPKHYRFRVLACNNSGVWNETGASLEFTVLPAYYQTTWFLFLCVAAFIGLLWTLYRLRLLQMQRQFAVGLEARVGERMRIARELHDTLLQSFQGVAFQLHAARKLIARKADNAPEVLEDAILATEAAIREGRSAIRDLRPEQATQRDLPELLNAVGHEQATSHQLNGSAPSYRVVIEGKQQNLLPMLQDEVYRISREAIRNAFAHSAASHIEVEIRYDHDQLRLRVRDDGKGIDPKVLEAGGESGHFGIPGMRERAQRIGSRLVFWSEVGAGTEVELIVPASMAYQKQRDGHRFRLFRRGGRDGQQS